jgi:Ca2+-binding RTX toxin-like protein
MKRKGMLLIGAMALALLLAGGVALAATLITCTTNSCNGTSQDDIILGTHNPETINALAGNDEVSAFLGNDIVYGGDGNDYVHGSEGNDTIYGGPNSDNKVNQGTEKGLIGAEDSDKVYGEGGANFIDLALDDTAGSEDYASGGPGNDTFHAFDGRKDAINCGSGRRDHVYYDKGI